mgnify:CR=1 FL=1
MTYFKRAEKNWRRVYEDETLIQILYQGWDLWLEVSEKNLKIGNSNCYKLIFVVYLNSELI